MGFKFQQNPTINEEFDFWGVKTPRRGQGESISKIRKIMIQNGGPNPHQKFSTLAKLESV